MSEIKWIKLSTDLFDNRKIKQIETLPDGDALIVIWIKLLCLAGDTNDNGFVYFTKEIPYTDQMLANQFNRPVTTIQLALSTFEKYGMIEVIDDVLCISNWEKYQNIEGMEKVREQNRLRKRRQRERERLLIEDKAKCHVTITGRHATDIDIDKDIDIDIDNACTREADLDFEDFWKAYPKKQSRPQAEHEFARALLNDVNLTGDLLVASAHNYAEAVRIEKRDERYIKAPNRFISDNTFVEYLPGNYKKPKPKVNNNKFLNHEQKDYGDMSELEKELLSYD